MNKNVERCLKKTKWGFYQYSPLPTEQELGEYYSNKYFQLAQSSYSYSTEYDEEEISWFRLQATLILMQVEKIRTKQKGSVLDVGCGEGWLLDTFHARGYEVAGMDYGRVAIERWNPHLLPYFSQGNSYELLQEQIRNKSSYDVIFLGNVIEHVLDPEQLLSFLFKLLSPTGVLVIVAPNDFSSLQDYILEKGFADAPWWLAYPDHLSYFNKESMTALVHGLGHSVRSTVSDFPMEFNLLSENTNYVKDRSLGPEAHRQRMRICEYLHSKSPNVLLSLYEQLGSIGVGRTLIYYCS